jgi:hypothetical protein
VIVAPPYAMQKMVLLIAVTHRIHRPIRPRSAWRRLENSVDKPNFIYDSHAWPANKKPRLQIATGTL